LFTIHIATKSFFQSQTTTTALKTIQKEWLTQPLNVHRYYSYIPKITLHKPHNNINLINSFFVGGRKTPP
jgi:hypothetical protein